MRTLRLLSQHFATFLHQTLKVSVMARFMRCSNPPKLLHQNYTQNYTKLHPTTFSPNFFFQVQNFFQRVSEFQGSLKSALRVWTDVNQNHDSQKIHVYPSENNMRVKELIQMLNPMQEKFCVEYIQSGNGKASYKAAFGVTNDGTARVNASKLLKNPEVQARLAELQAEMASAKICAAKEIQERLSSIARRELTETLYLPNGAKVEKPASIRDSVRALELLAKINGMFVQRQEVELNGAVPVVIRDDL